MIVAVGEKNWCADERKFFADFALEKALIGPMQKSKFATMNDEPGRTSVGLDDIFQLGASVFQASGGMFEDGFAEDFVEFRSFDFLVASLVDFECEFKKFSDVFAGGAAGDEDWSVG